MDIQLLINAPGHTNGNRTASGDAKAPGGEFARHLAGASQNGAREAAAPSGRDASRQATSSAAPLGQGEAPTDATTRREALEALLARASSAAEATGETGETGKKGENAHTAAKLAPLLDGEAGRSAWAGLSANEVEAALQSLQQGGPRPGSSASADKGQSDGAWDALQERLALIEQAGRPEADDALALLPLAAAVGPAGASTPGTATSAAPTPGGAGQPMRTNPLLEAIAADRRAPAGPSASSAAALSAAAERLSAQGTGQAAATSEEALRVAATGDALLAQRGETSRAGAGLEPAGQGASAMSGVMQGATGGGMAGALNGAATPSQASLPAPVASPAWSQQLGQQLVRLSQQGGEQHVELKLHPAELGPLSVSLKMSDHGAQAQFVSAHAQVRQALEQAIPQLREALAEQGISLGETSVGEQRQGGTEGDGTSARPGEMLASAGGDAAEDGTTVALEERGARELPLDGRVDLYA